jgi:glycosyltransferase involved in cell wall biosynthesis
MAAFSLPKELETCGFKISVALPGGKTLLHLQVCDQEGQWHKLTSWTAKVPRYLTLPFWPKKRSTEDPAESYGSWIERYERPNWWQDAQIRRKAQALEYQPLFSVLLPTFNTPATWLIAAIESIRKQSYSNWELCISDDASTKAHVRQILRRYARRDRRIKVHYRDVNGHISASSNSALALASGEFVALLDHDDEFAPHALYAAALALNRCRDLDLIYSDEDKIDEHGWRFDPYLKSDWNPDLLTAQNCVSHLGIFRTARLREVGGFREGLEGCQDWDVALRVTEGISASRVCHIPRVLYHWRAIPGSTALSLDEKSYIDESAKKMLMDHFERLGNKTVIAPVEGGHWGVKYRLSRRPLVTVIIPTRNHVALLRRCVGSILAQTDYSPYELLVVDNQSTEPSAKTYLDDLARSGVRVLEYTKPFNYSAINNFAVDQAHGELVCFLNNDMEVITGNWLEDMVSHALRPEIGAVGAKLFFPDGRLQHTGIVLGLGGPAGHILYKFNGNTGGYYNRARLICNYTAVTAACMVIRKSVFREAGGFDADHLPISYNDVDLCIRVQELGYRNLYLPFAQLYHHESASRGEDSTDENCARSAGEIDYMWRKWGELLLHDPGYNPNLSLQREDYSFATPPRIAPIWEEEIAVGSKRLTRDSRPIPAYWTRQKEELPETPTDLRRTTRSAADVVTVAYRRVLGRPPDASDLLVYCKQLQEGQTLQWIIAQLVKSSEFRELVSVKAHSVEQGLTWCYDRLLGRLPDVDGLRNLTKSVGEQGWDPIIRGFVYCEEYEGRFGSYTVPYPIDRPELALTWTPGKSA